MKSTRLTCARSAGSSSRRVMMSWRINQTQVKRILDYVSLGNSDEAKDLVEILDSVYENMRITNQDYVYIHGRP